MKCVLPTTAALWLALSGVAIGQASIKDQLVGTWLLVSQEGTNQDGSRTIFEGSNLKGILMFDVAGRFAFQTGVDLPRFAANDRMKATPEEAVAVMRGMIAYYGTYSVDDNDRVINLNIERSSFPNQIGTAAKRFVTSLSEDELKYSIRSRTGGGELNTTWRRAN